VLRFWSSVNLRQDFFIGSSGDLGVLLDLLDVHRPDPDHDMDPLGRLFIPVLPESSQLLVALAQPLRRGLRLKRGCRACSVMSIAESLAMDIHGKMIENRGNFRPLRT